MRRATVRKSRALLLALVLMVSAVLGPLASAAPGKVNLNLVGADVAEVFRALAEVSGLNIVLDPSVRGTLTVKLQDVEIDEALKLVAYAAGVEYTTRGSSLIVTPKGVVSSLEAPVTVQLPLKHARTGDVAAALAMTAPNTRLQADARTNSFIAQGPAGEIDSLRNVLALLDVPVEEPEEASEVAGEAEVEPEPVAVPEPEPAPVETVRIVALEHAPAPEMAEMLRVMLEQGKVQADPRTNSLVVLADDEAWARAERIIRGLDLPVPEPVSDMVAAAPAPEEAVLTLPAEPIKPEPADAVRVIKVNWAPVAQIRSALTPVLDQVRLGYDERSNSLVVVSVPEQIQRVEEVVALLDVPLPEPAEEPVQGTPAPEPQPTDTIDMIELRYADASAVKAALAAILPPDKVIADERTASLVIIGTPDQHVKARSIASFLDRPGAKVAENGKVEANGAEEAEPDAAAQAPAPVAEPAQVEQPAPVKSVKAYRLAHADPESVRRALSLVLPGNAIEVDARTRSVLVLGFPEDHNTVAEVVAMLDIEVEPEEVPVEDVIAEMPEPVAVAVEPEPVEEPEVTSVVRLQNAAAAQVRENLAYLVPEVKVSADQRTNSLILMGVADQVKKAEGLVAELDIAVPKPEEPAPEVESAEVIRLAYASPAEVREALAPTMPVSKISIDERTASVVIVGTQAQRRAARAIIAQLDVEVPKPAEPVVAEVEPEPEPQSEPEELHVVKLTHAPAAQVREALAPVVPLANITVDERTNSLIMVAPASRAARALAVVEKLDVAVAAPEADVPAAEPVLAPEPEPEPEPPVVATHKVAYADAQGLKPAVGLLVPQANIQVDSRTNTLVVLAEPAVQGKVAELVAALDVPIPEPPPAPAPEPDAMRVFRLSHAAASDMKALLGSVIPATSLQADDRTGSLVVVAGASALARAAELIQALDVPGAAELVAPEAEPVDREVVRVYRLNYADPDDVAAVLGGFVSGTVTADARTTSVAVKAPESQHAQVLELIDALDTALPQVLIEARLEELSGDAGRQLGLDWSFEGITLGHNALGQIVNVTLDVFAKLNVLEEQGKARLISRQHTFTVDGRTGRMLIGDRIPVLIQEVEQGQVVNRVDFINAGIELAITPKVSPDGTITAQVKPVISSIVGWTPQNYPQIRTRELETIVSLKSGQTAVIGGLLHHDEIESLAKVPILGDIPLLGELFKRRTTTGTDTEVVMFLTAWQVNPDQRTVVGPAQQDDRFPIAIETLEPAEPVNW